MHSWLSKTDPWFEIICGGYMADELILLLPNLLTFEIVAEWSYLQCPSIFILEKSINLSPEYYYLREDAFAL